MTWTDSRCYRRWWAQRMARVMVKYASNIFYDDSQSWFVFFFFAFCFVPLPSSVTASNRRSNLLTTQNFFCFFFLHAWFASHPCSVSLALSLHCFSFTSSQCSTILTLAYGDCDIVLFPVPIKWVCQLVGRLSLFVKQIRFCPCKTLRSEPPPLTTTPPKCNVAK